jgi:hypothetical protein
VLEALLAEPGRAGPEAAVEPALPRRDAATRQAITGTRAALAPYWPIFT